MTGESGNYRHVTAGNRTGGEAGRPAEPITLADRRGATCPSLQIAQKDRTYRPSSPCGQFEADAEHGLEQKRAIDGLAAERNLSRPSE